MLMIKKLNCALPAPPSPAGNLKGQTLGPLPLADRSTMLNTLRMATTSAQTSCPLKSITPLPSFGSSFRSETLVFQLLTSPGFDSLRTCCADVRDTTAPYRSCLLYFHTRRCRKRQLARWSGKRTLTSVDGAFRLSDYGSEIAYEGTIRIRLAGPEHKDELLSVAALHDLLSIVLL